MKNAVGYVRVSTDGQFGDDAFGAENQKAAIEKWAGENDYQIVKWYVDVISGAKDNRPQMDELLFGCEVANPPYEAVIAWKNDRIARDTKLYFYYLYTLEKKGVKLICTDEQFGDDDPFANVYRSLLQFVAEQERRNITMRTSGGRKIKSHNGGYSGGNLPYGYRSKNGRYEIIEEEAEAVRRIFSMDAAGMSLRKIAASLAEDGIKNRSGEPITFNNVRSILSNRKTYGGFYRYGDMEEYVKGDFEAIL